MSSHSMTKLRFNMIFQNQMQSKIGLAYIKHVSYSIVHVLYRTSTFQCEQAASCALPLVLEKYLRTSHINTGSKQMCVLCTPDLTPQHSTAACTHKMSANKKINDSTEVPQKIKLFSLQEKLNIINKHDARITNVKINRYLGVQTTLFCVSFPYSGNISAIYTCYASRLR